MKNWLPILLLAGAAAEAPPELVELKGYMRTSESGRVFFTTSDSIASDMLCANKLQVMKPNAEGGFVAMGHVIALQDNLSDRGCGLAMAPHEADGPCLFAVEGDTLVKIPLFELADRLGFEYMKIDRTGPKPAVVPMPLQ